MTLFKHMASAGIAAAMMAIMPSGVSGQPSCAPYAEQARQLAERFGETVVGVGVLPDGVVIELFATPDGGTWTLLLRPDADRACLAAAGTDWVPTQSFFDRRERRT